MPRERHERSHSCESSELKHQHTLALHVRLRDIHADAIKKTYRSLGTMTFAHYSVKHSIFAVLKTFTVLDFVLCCTKLLKLCSDYE